MTDEERRASKAAAARRYYEKKKAASTGISSAAKEVISNAAVPNEAKKAAKAAASRRYYEKKKAAPKASKAPEAPKEPEAPKAPPIDYEARNAERRTKSLEQLKAATAHMKPGVREDTYQPPRKVTAADIPEDVVKSYILPFLKGKEFNLGKVFFEAGSDFRRRAIGVLILLKQIAEGKDEKRLYEARADEYPNSFLSTYFKPHDKHTKQLIDADPFYFVREMVAASGEYVFEAPSEEQIKMLRNGFPEWITIEAHRRKGSMGSKSGIIIVTKVESTGLNLRTKVGKAEILKRQDEVSAIATGYLKRIYAKDYAAFFKALVNKGEKKREEFVAKKAEARSAYDFAKSEKKAQFEPPDNWLHILKAFFYPSEERAVNYRASLAKIADGRQAKFWIPRGKNLQLAWSPR